MRGSLRTGPDKFASNAWLLLEVLDDGGGWKSSLTSRASWLLGLLVCQSWSALFPLASIRLLGFSAGIGAHCILLSESVAAS